MPYPLPVESVEGPISTCRVLEPEHDQPVQKLRIKGHRPHPKPRQVLKWKRLTAVSVAALTIYDMCKAIDQNNGQSSDIRLLQKIGGSGK